MIARRILLKSCLAAAVFRVLFRWRLSCHAAGAAAAAAAVVVVVRLAAAWAAAYADADAR